MRSKIIAWLKRAKGEALNGHPDPCDHGQHRRNGMSDPVTPEKWSMVRQDGGLSVMFSFYAPEGAQFSMPIAVLSGLLKSYFPNITRYLCVINKLMPEEECSIEWFRREVERLKPDLLAISCMSPHWKDVRDYLTAAKEASPSTTILVGGYQSIFTPDETISHPAVDIICIGDGEDAFIALVNALLDNANSACAAKVSIPGMWVKGADGVVLKSQRMLTKDLNKFPFPDYSIYEKNGSLHGLAISMFGPQEKFILMVMSGRGCSYKCTYCANTPMLEMYKGEGSYIRKYDIGALIGELKMLRDKYAVEYFEFLDELFMVNIKHSLAFLERYGAEIGLPFSINARVEKMDDNFCRVARAAGCQNIWFGLESGSERYRTDKLGRKMKNEDILRAAENAKRHGIRRLTFNIVGMPFESLHDAEETLALNRAIAPEFFYFFTYLPLEGTPLYDFARHNNLLLSEGTVSAEYLKGLRTQEFAMNLREHEGGMTTTEFNDICRRMAKFMQENNRLEM